MGGLTIPSSNINDYLPLEALAHIFVFVGEPQIISRVCKKWKDAQIATYSSLIGDYRKNPSFHLIHVHNTLEEHPHVNMSIVKALYEYVQSLTKYSNRSFVEQINRRIKNKLSAARLEALIAHGESRVEYLALKELFDSLSVCVPGANAYMSLYKNKRVEVRQKAIEEWMDQNTQLLKKFKYIFFVKKRSLTLSSKIGLFTSLEVLFIRGNCHLKFLPQELGQLSNLTQLYLASNSLVVLPQEIGSLKKLKELNVCYNALVSLPSSIGQLECLEFLFLHHNRIHTLPNEIIQLKNLKRLEINSNLLTHMVSEINQLRSLVWLDLQLNPLTTIPSKIGELTNLHLLDLSYCRITRIPDQMCDIENLYVFRYKGNPLLPLTEKMSAFMKKFRKGGGFRKKQKT